MEWIILVLLLAVVCLQIIILLKNHSVQDHHGPMQELRIALSKDSAEGQLRFFTWKELETIDMPVSARHMMDHYLKVGRFDENRYAGITEPEGSRFVMLQHFE